MSVRKTALNPVNGVGAPVSSMYPFNLNLILPLTFSGVYSRGTDAAESRVRSSFDFVYQLRDFFHLDMQVIRGFQNVEAP